MVDHDLHKGTPTEYRLEYREALIIRQDYDRWGMEPSEVKGKDTLENETNK